LKIKERFWAVFWAIAKVCCFLIFLKNVKNIGFTHSKTLFQIRTAIFFVQKNRKSCTQRFLRYFSAFNTTLFVWPKMAKNGQKWPICYP